MQFPGPFSRFNLLVALWAAAVAVWTLVEGGAQSVIVLGFLTALTGLAVIFQRRLSGRRFAAVPGILLMGLSGLLLGAGTILMSLLLMAVKTGLHGHGPEFSLLEMVSVWQQLPLSCAAGLLGGLGAGLLLLARRTPDGR